VAKANAHSLQPRRIQFGRETAGSLAPLVATQQTGFGAADTDALQAMFPASELQLDGSAERTVVPILA